MRFRPRHAKSLVVLLAALSTVFSCGKESSYKNPDKSSFRPPANTEVGFTRSLISRQALFSAYVPKAERLTIVDPSSLNEIWGEQVGKNFIDAVPLAGNDGIALVGPDELRVYSGGKHRTFGLSGFKEESSWAVANDTATLAFANGDRQSAQIIRYLGETNWQVKTISIPTTEASEVVGVLVSQSGKYLMSVSSPGGNFDIYMAENALSEYDTPFLTCRSDTQSTSETVRAGFLDETSDLALLATEEGDSYKIKIVEINQSAACISQTLWPEIVTGSKTNYLSKMKSGAFAAALSDGRVLIISITDIQGAITKEIRTPCSSAIGTAEGDDGTLFIRCVGWVHAYSSGEFNLLHSEEINTKHALTPAFDSATSTAYYLENGGLGKAHSINLVTGEKRSRTGIFTRGIFSNR